MVAAFGAVYWGLRLSMRASGLLPKVPRPAQ
jgi:hypothetical protein